MAKADKKGPNPATTDKSQDFNEIDRIADASHDTDEALDAANAEQPSEPQGDAAPPAPAYDPYAAWNAPAQAAGASADLDLASEFGEEVVQGVHELNWDIVLTDKAHYRMTIVGTNVGNSKSGNRQLTVTAVVDKAIDPTQVGCAVQSYLPMPTKETIATDRQKLARFLRLAKLTGLAETFPNGTVKGFKKGASVKDLMDKQVWFQAGIDPKDKNDPSAGYWNRIERFLSEEEVVGH